MTAMQIKKEIFLFCSLIVISIGLLIAADFSKPSQECSPTQGKFIKCCQETLQPKVESPWNFIASGLFHLTA
jgi:hypothetical protein